jgi:hypothetical protein
MVIFLAPRRLCAEFFFPLALEEASATASAEKTESLAKAQRRKENLSDLRSLCVGSQMVTTGHRDCLTIA